MSYFLDKLFGRRRPQKLGLEDLVRRYGVVLERNTSSIIRDVSELPATKKEMRAALKTAISLTPPGAMREQLRNGFIMLADFQDLKACRRANLDPQALMLREGQELLDELDALDGRR